MKKFYLLAAGMMVAMSMMLSSCNDKKKNEVLGNDTYVGQKTEETKLTPDQSKERLMHVAKLVTGKFNTADQKAAVNLADQLYDKYQDYDMSAFENHYENRYDVLFAIPRYVVGVARGARVPTAVDHTYIFNFANESAIFEANDRTLSWEYKGPSPDNSMILRCTDAGGRRCEAKVWGEGATHRYQYSWEDEGTRTAIGDIPEKVIFSFKQGDNEIIRAEFGLELVKNDHAYLSINARIANLSWIADVKVNSTNGSAAYIFKYGDEKLFSVAANLPSYQLIDKADNQSYEDWIDQYGDNYNTLLRQVGGVDALVDIYGWVQLKVNIDNFGYLYRDVKKLDNGGFFTRDATDARKLVESINSHMDAGLYYGSDIKQASIIAKLAREKRQDYDYYDYNQGRWIYNEYDEYYAEGVMYFENDGTTYAFDQYFDRKPFTDLEYTLEDIANKYIKLSRYLYDEVGEVEF